MQLNLKNSTSTTMVFLIAPQFLFGFQHSLGAKQNHSFDTSEILLVKDKYFAE
jgi:hypothetical protein